MASGGYSITPRIGNWPIFRRVGPILVKPIHLCCSPEGKRCVGRVYIHYFGGCASLINLCTPAKTPRKTPVATKPTRRPVQMRGNEACSLPGSMEVAWLDATCSRLRPTVTVTRAQLRCLRIAHAQLPEKTTRWDRSDAHAAQKLVPENGS